MISTSFIQTRIVKQLTQNFIKTTQQKISFNDLKLRWNGKLEFSNLFIEDHHKDTLLYVKALETSLLNFRNLKENNFKLSDFNTNGSLIKLKKYKGENDHSFKVLLKKLQKDSSSKSESFVKIEKLELANLTFIYEDKNKISSSPIYLDSIFVKANSLSFEKNNLQVELDNIEGEIYSPQSKPFKTRGLLNYTPGNLFLENFELLSGESNLRGNLQLIGANNSFRDFKSKGTFNVEVLESYLDLPSLFPDHKYLSGFPALDASLLVEGGLSFMELKKIQLSNEIINYHGSLKVNNLGNNKLITLKLLTDSLLVKTKKLEPIKFISKEIKDRLNQLTKLYIRGKTIILKDSIFFDLNSTNPWGAISIKGDLGKGIFDKSNSNKNFFLKANFDELELSQWISKPLKLKTKFSAIGNLSNKDNPEFSWIIDDAEVSSDKFNIRGISVEGRINDNKLINTLSVDSKILKLKSDVLYNFNLNIPQTTLLANIEKLDLNSIGLKIGKGKREFKGIVLSNITGNSFNKLNGSIKISSAFIENEENKIMLNPISVFHESKDKNATLKIINSDCLEGEAEGSFKINEIGSLFKNSIHQVYPFLPKKKISINQKIHFKLKIYKKLLDALYPSLSISENINLNGNIDSEKSYAQIVLDAPLIKYKEIQFENINFQIDTKNPLFNSFLSVGNFSNNYFKGKDFNLTSSKMRDTIFFNSKFKGDKNSTSPFEINLYQAFKKDGSSSLGFKKSIIPIGSDTWTINSTNGDGQIISYSARQKETILSSLEASSGNQSISISGSYLNPNAFDLKLDLKNILLENLLPIFPTFKITGLGNLNANVSRSNSKNQLNIKSNINNLNINGQPLGDLNLSAKGNTKLNTYIANIELLQGLNTKLEIKGLFQGLDDPSLNFNLNLNDLDIAFLSTLGKKALNQFHGKVGGSVTILGSLSDIKHNGSLSLTDGGFSVPFLNLNYNIEPANVTLSNKKFIFKSLRLQDEVDGTFAIMNGSFSHSNFSDWLADVSITSERMLLLNTSQGPESLFFGQGYLGGTVNLNGPTKNLKISLQGSTESGTSIKIPWSESYGLSDTSFVSFINKNRKTSFKKDDTTDGLDEIKGLELDFELDVNKNATVEIVIDKESGSYLSGRGAGNLLMEINTKGKFNMWGDFITYDGIYNFKNLGVIDKKFNLKSGGTIVWEGNPLEAQMALEAVYDVPGGANPALLLDNPNFNKNIPTEVLIRLQGNLLKPDDPIFEIDFPNTSGTVASEINYRLADPQRSQMQAISLLSQGIFINEVSVSMQGITNNLYQKASDIVSNLISEDTDKLKVGIDYLQGDKSALLDIATEDRLGFTLSTQISDKILLNGKIGVPVGGLEQTLIVGNVQIDFILNEEGSLRAKVFNKENEFRYIGDELGYTQGLGLSYDVDFNTFKDLINKIVLKRNSTNESSILQKNEDEDLIKFIKKNKL